MSITRVGIDPQELLGKAIFDDLALSVPVMITHLCAQEIQKNLDAKNMRDISLVIYNKIFRIGVRLQNVMSQVHKETTTFRDLREYRNGFRRLCKLIESCQNLNGIDFILKNKKILWQIFLNTEHFWVMTVKGFLVFSNVLRQQFLDILFDTAYEMKNIMVVTLSKDYSNDNKLNEFFDVTIREIARNLSMNRIYIEEFIYYTKRSLDLVKTSGAVLTRTLEDKLHSTSSVDQKFAYEILIEFLNYYLSIMYKAINSIDPIVSLTEELTKTLMLIYPIQNDLTLHFIEKLRKNLNKNLISFEDDCRRVDELKNDSMMVYYVILQNLLFMNTMAKSLIYDNIIDEDD